MLLPQGKKIQYTNEATAEAQRAEVSYLGKQKPVIKGKDEMLAVSFLMDLSSSVPNTDINST